MTQGRDAPRVIPLRGVGPYRGEIRKLLRSARRSMLGALAAMEADPCRKTAGTVVRISGRLEGLLDVHRLMCPDDPMPKTYARDVVRARYRADLIIEASAIDDAIYALRNEGCTCRAAEALANKKKPGEDR